MMGSANNGVGKSKSRSMDSNPIPNFPVAEWLCRIIHAISRWLPRLPVEYTAKLALTPTGS
jgi:hypothetical protein